MNVEWPITWAKLCAVPTQRNHESAAWECVVRPLAEIVFPIGVLALSGVVCGVLSLPVRCLGFSRTRCNACLFFMSWCTGQEVNSQKYAHKTL